MRLLQVKPEIYKFDNIKSFSEFFNIGSGDLILTNEFLYTPFMKELNLTADFLLREKYGRGEPSDEMIDAIMKDVNPKDYKRIIAIGGGSIVDIAKLLVINNVTKTLDLFEKKIPIVKGKELIIVPTTCGTGSEVTNISIVEFKAKHTKMGLATDELFADYAILIPELVKVLPYKFFVTSSVDALIHAVESYVSPKSNTSTELFSIKAIELILNGYISIVKKGPEHRLEIIDDFLIGSNLAGIAFSNAGVGAVHALSYPLGGSYHVPHGEANYQFFTEVFKAYNIKNPNGKIKKINSILAEILCVPNDDNIYDELSKVLDTLLVRKPLREYGMKIEEIESFTDNVIEGQQRLLVNNYAHLDREEILTIYKKLY
ncbi:4-hydroxybutyrate dehydrogenase [Clostridium akagii]|uniref:4-hydroxybutyrate dehydrogenase n=1 Tax=Clostridium akagii TaxID=91623 RepID=UPI00047A1CEA|nr:4-hydroxybutyrate dehydrogenase [Clostridium akagii]